MINWVEKCIDLFFFFVNILGSCIEVELCKPVGYLLRINLVQCRGQSQNCLPHIFGSMDPSQFSPSVTCPQKNVWAFESCDVFLSYDLRLVDLILCLIWSGCHATLLRWPLLARWENLMGRIPILSLAKGDVVLSSIYSILYECNTESSAGVCSNAILCSIASVLREHQLHILSKNLFFDHFLATCLPPGQLCCFNWLTLFNSCFNSQHNHHNCINCAIFQYQQLPLPFICF